MERLDEDDLARLVAAAVVLILACLLRVFFCSCVILIDFFYLSIRCVCVCVCVFCCFIYIYLNVRDYEIIDGMEWNGRINFGEYTKREHEACLFLRVSLNMYEFIARRADEISFRRQRVTCN